MTPRFEKPLAGVGDRSQNKQLHHKSGGYLVGLSVLLLILAILSFGIGKYPIPPRELLQVLFGKLTGAAAHWSPEAELVIYKIRMPRLLAGVLIGAGLSASGAAYQGVFRNPMVSPDLLGASSGAGFGAACSLFLGLGYAAVAANAFVCGIIAVMMAYLISTRARQNATLGLVLAGIMVSSLFTAGTSFIKLVADPNNVLPAITYWLMGSISNMTLQKLRFACVPIVVGIVVLFFLRWRLNLLTMGEDEARAMGVNTKMIRAIVILSATLISAACVSISGLIGWIGLVIPHFARMLVGYNYKVLLPASMLLGASFFVVVDGLARSITTTEIPIGILTAFVGAPFFLWLIFKKGGSL